MGLAKSLAIVGIESSCLALLSIPSQGAIKHPLSLVVKNGG